MATNQHDLNDPVLCACSGTRRSLVEQLHRQGMDIDAISRYTGAISGCGGCEWDISGLLIELVKIELANKTELAHQENKAD